MAQLTINQCQKCGKILAPGVTKCGKCHTEHSVIPAVVNPLRFTAAEAAEYRSEFEEQVKEFPKDSQPGVAMISPAMVLSQSKRSLDISAGRIAMESQASSLELNAPPRQ